MQTLAAILVEQKKPLVVDTITVPEPSFGQVLVEIAYSTICGAQLGEIDGAKGPDKYLPHLLGHEASGHVVSVGPGVTKVVKGDTVILHWRQGDGKQADPAVYEWKGKKLNAGWITTFQMHTIVCENRVTKVPSTIDLTIAPLFGCAITTGFGVITNDAQVKIGQSVVVFGCGGVGLNILQAAHLAGAYPIVGLDITPEKLAMAKKFGATHVIDSRVNDRNQQLLKIVGEEGADVVIEATGIIKLMEDAYTLTNKNGKTILVGVPKDGEQMSFYALPIFFKKELKGSHGGSSNPSVDIARYLRMLDVGKISFDGLVTHTFPLQRINEAITIMRSGIAGRIALSMSE